MDSGWPIIVVTGANGGVGFGICQRLLIQLSQRQPPDAQPQFRYQDLDGKDESVQIPPCDGLTLILACRSIQRAEAARDRLHELLDAHVAKQKRLSGYDGHADLFSTNVKIEIEYLDLAKISTVFEFSRNIKDKFPYVSHLICNAGIASFTALDIPAFCRQIIRTGPITAITTPEYNLQSAGQLSVDGFGLVWQCNVFGHYALFRSLEPSLLCSKSSLGSRVIWMSSLESSPKFYDADDWQLTKTTHSYESAKYQIDLIATHLDKSALQGQEREPVRHFIVEPGVSHTNISQALVGWFIVDMFKLFSFYLARWFGSVHHTIEPYTAAVAAVYASIAPLAFIPVYEGFLTSKKPLEKMPSTATALTQIEPGSRPGRLGSQSDRLGHAKIGLTAVRDWEVNEHEGLKLLERCDELYSRVSEDSRKSR